nr:translation initiation factor IF-2-like [Anas platyrhynchos]
MGTGKDGMMQGEAVGSLRFRREPGTVPKAPGAIAPGSAPAQDSRGYRCGRWHRARCRAGAGHRHRHRHRLASPGARRREPRCRAGATVPGVPGHASRQECARPAGAGGSGSGPRPGVINRRGGRRRADVCELLSSRRAAARAGRWGGDGDGPRLRRPCWRCRPGPPPTEQQDAAACPETPLVPPTMVLRESPFPNRPLAALDALAQGLLCPGFWALNRLLDLQPTTAPRARGRGCCGCTGGRWGGWRARRCCCSRCP